jgi:CheY-like chemotaxis protein
MPPPVLIVDDDADMRECLKDMLEGEGYSVIEARDGQQGLRLIEEGLLPCAIVVDHRMPLLTGGEFVEELDRRKLSAGVPVVLITGDLKAPRPLRADLVLFKPFPPEALLDALRPHCQPAVAA